MEPFFGDGSIKVLTSKMSESLPASDAGLGVLAYTFEFLMGWMGSQARWRTMPWMVTIFGILVIPLGMVHILLVISQPVVVGHWCTFCLLAALVMLPMIPLEVDEVVAMIQFIISKVKQKESFWEVFWLGSGTESKENQPEMIHISKFPAKPFQVFSGSIKGVSFSWTLFIASLTGIWFMAAPSVFGIKGISADTQHLAGALTTAFSVMAMGEVIRSGRLLNIPTGLSIAIVPWFAGNPDLFPLINSTTGGILIALISIPEGKITNAYGEWNKWIV